MVLYELSRLVQNEEFVIVPLCFVVVAVFDEKKVRKTKDRFNM